MVPLKTKLREKENKNPPLVQRALFSDYNTRKPLEEGDEGRGRERENSERVVRMESIIVQLQLWFVNNRIKAPLILLSTLYTLVSLPIFFHIDTLQKKNLFIPPSKENLLNWISNEQRQREPAGSANGR